MAQQERGRNPMMGDFDNAIDAFFDAPEGPEKAAAFQKIYETELAKTLALVVMHNPDLQREFLLIDLKRRQGEEYEQYLFRDGAIEIGYPDAVINNVKEYWQESHDSNAEEEVEGLPELVRKYLYWGKRFDGVIPAHWWDVGKLNRYTFRLPRHNYRAIEVDFEVAGVFGVQLSPPLIDAAVSIGSDGVLKTIAKSQYLDHDQLAVGFWRMHEEYMSIAAGSKEENRAEASANWERNFEENQREIIQTQQAMGVLELIIDTGLQTYQQLREGTIAPESLERLRARFVPEYLPTAESLRRPNHNGG